MKQKMETAKKILLFSDISSVVLTCVIIYFTCKGIECSSLATVTCLSWGETATSHAFYYNKTKKENLPKVVMHLYDGLPEKLKDEVDINQLLSSLTNSN